MLFIFSNQWISETFLKALYWTFIHSLWQGVTAAIITGVIISNTRKTRASLRYNLLVILFACLLLVIGLSFLAQLSHLSSPKENTPFVTIKAGNAAPLPYTESTSSIGFKKESLINKFTAYCNEHAVFIMLIWFLVFTIKCLQVFYGLYYIQRLKKFLVYSPLEEWSDKITQLSKTLGICRKVVLVESRLIDIPLTIGHLKATVLVPLGLLTNLPPEQVEAVLLHELAHIRRSDYLVNLLQSFAETFLFFNPALLWISALIRREREACCDDIVLQNRPHQKTYFQALVSFQEYSLSSVSTAMAMAGRKNDLLERIRRILTHKNQNLNTMERIFLMLGTIALTAFSFISKTNTPVKNTPHVLYQSKPDSPVTNTASPVINNNSFSNSSSSDAVHKGVIKHAEGARINQANEKKVSIDSADSEKPYCVIDGIAYVLSQGGYATTGEFTDIIYVDRKRMSPDEVNKSIKRSSVKGVGATGGEAAQKKYGLDKPVLEIFINTSPQMNGMLWQGPSEEQKPLAQDQGAKSKEQTDNGREQVYDQQRQLGMQEKRRQKQEELMQKQKKVLARQQALIEKAEQVKMQAAEQVKEQAEQGRIQAGQAKEQAGKAKLQSQIVDTLRQEMVKDGLIRPNERYDATLNINSKEMLINGKKQPTAIHQKYLEIINRKREKAFGKTEE